MINTSGEAAGSGDVIVSAELWEPGTPFEVAANSAQSATGTGYSGTHPVGSTVSVRGRSQPTEPAFLEIRDVAPAEVLVLITR